MGLVGMKQRRVWYCRGGLIVLGVTRIRTHVAGLVEARQRRVWRLQRGVDRAEEGGTRRGRESKESARGGRGGSR